MVEMDKYVGYTFEIFKYFGLLMNFPGIGKSSDEMDDSDQESTNF